MTTRSPLLIKLGTRWRLTGWIDIINALLRGRRNGSTPSSSKLSSCRRSGQRLRRESSVPWFGGSLLLHLLAAAIGADTGNPAPVRPLQGESTTVIVQLRALTEPVSAKVAAHKAPPVKKSEPSLKPKKKLQELLRPRPLAKTLPIEQKLKPKVVKVRPPNKRQFVEMSTASVGRVEELEVQPTPAKQPLSSPVSTSAMASSDLPVKLEKPRFREPPNPPRYPSRAQRLNQQGVVMVKALLNPNGEVTDVEVEASSGHRLLDQAALHAVARWRFIPARRGGSPVIAEVVIPIRFTIRG